SHLTHYSHCRTPLHLSSNLFPYTTLFRSNQLGFVVRGIYGEGSEAIGNVFQVSNQITLGKTEEEIVLDLESVILKLMEAERKARQHLLNHSPIHVENKIYRAYGLLKHSRIMES